MKAIWKGSIGFGLVNIPVKLYSAVQNSNLDFDMLDSKDLSHIRFQRVNEKTKKEVPFDKIVKGYEVNGKYVLLDHDDFVNASPEKSKMIELENFVDISEINPIYYETSYFVEPEPQGKKAYALLLKVLSQAKKAGVARFVLRTSENLCVIHPLGGALIITKIRFAEEIRSMEDLNIPSVAGVTKKETDVGMALIKQYTSKFDITSFKDEYSSALLKLIRAKAKGKAAKVKKLERAEASAGSDLYEQLMQSLTKKGA